MYFFDTLFTSGTNFRNYKRKISFKIYSTKKLSDAKKRNLKNKIELQNRKYRKVFKIMKIL